MQIRKIRTYEALILGILGVGFLYGSREILRTLRGEVGIFGRLGARMLSGFRPRDVTESILQTQVCDTEESVQDDDGEPDSETGELWYVSEEGNEYSSESGESVDER